MKAEMALLVLAYNLTRAMNIIVTNPPLIAAIAANLAELIQPELGQSGRAG
jgi:hypothetical protein